MTPGFYIYNFHLEDILEWRKYKSTINDEKCKNDWKTFGAENKANGVA